MRVLITGHRGYIGTVLVPMMRNRGFSVSGMDSDLYRRCTFGEDFEEIPGCRKDIRDAELSDLAGFDAVIHLAALSNDPLGNLSPEITYDVNYQGTVRLACSLLALILLYYTQFIYFFYVFPFAIYRSIYVFA